jgi:hypothetical protein
MTERQRPVEQQLVLAQFVQRQLSQLDPLILQCILECTNEQQQSDLEHAIIAKLTKSEPCSVVTECDSRLANAKFTFYQSAVSNTSPFDELNPQNPVFKRRGKGYYYFVATNHENQIFRSQGLPKEIRYSGEIQIQDLVDVLRRISYLVQHEQVESFMIGKASHSKLTSGKRSHDHSGMVKRFGNKYLGTGYSHMVGLASFDGEMSSTAEADALNLESRLHLLLREIEDCHGVHKFNRSLSNSQSGSLSKKHSSAIFMVYVALRKKEINEESKAP